MLGRVGVDRGTGLATAPRPTPHAPSTWGWLLALLVLAGVLRLPGLGYHEFHIDEVWSSPAPVTPSVARMTPSPAIPKALANWPLPPSSIVRWARPTSRRHGYPSASPAWPAVLGLALLGRRLFEGESANSRLLVGAALRAERLCPRPFAHRAVSGRGPVADGDGGAGGMDLCPAG